jgi:hypothetical protein
MEASSQRTSQLRLALMLIVGVAAAAACVVTLMWWKAPVASAQEEAPTGANFVVQCGFSKQAQVDPIVNPGEPGTPEAIAHHLHDFFGNTTTDSNSTLESLRTAQTPTDPATTCEPKPGLPPDATFGDTAAYWIPTVSWTDSRGKTTQLKANQEFFYYRAGLKDPDSVEPFPAGLKIVTVQGKNVEWRCQNGDWSTRPPTRCENGKLVVRIFFPDCLAEDPSGQPLLDTRDEEGNTLHVPDDHRSHMVAAGSAGCPITHPYSVPRLQTNFQFPIPTTKGKPTLSSGEYSTMHVDFFNAWQEGTPEDLVARCINDAPFSASNPKDADCGA